MSYAILKPEFVFLFSVDLWGRWVGSRTHLVSFSSFFFGHTMWHVAS